MQDGRPGLFPAAALAPVVCWLARHRVPRPLAALLAMVAALAVVAGVVALVVPSFVAQLPALGQSLTQSAGQLDRLLQGAALHSPGHQHQPAR
ncbi:MAG: AI-2E family transporter [Pseudonocardiaceae bacterium]|nr:AI-2E family transporter [Pseudonocardiaceae bacterium]